MIFIEGKAMRMEYNGIISEIAKIDPDRAKELEILYSTEAGILVPLESKENNTDYTNQPEDI